MPFFLDGIGLGSYSEEYLTRRSKAGGDGTLDHVVMVGSDVSQNEARGRSCSDGKSSRGR